jgi:hypothetical protein
MVGTPVQWALLAAVALLLFAPALVPVIARMLGRTVRMEVRRRYGITLGNSSPKRPSAPIAHASPKPRVVDLPDSKLIDTIEPAVTPEQPIADHTEKPRMPVWAVSALVLGAAAVLLWLLLHWR